MRRPTRDEQGAIAILTALLSVVLFAAGALVVDLGMAYVSRLSLQTAADAASLAVAQRYASSPGWTCPELLAQTPAATARALADAHLASNQASVTEAAVATVVVTCNGGRFRASVDVEGRTPTWFGRLTGAGTHLTERAHAAASVHVASGGTGVLPLALCSAEVPLPMTPGTVWRSYVPGTGGVPATSCPAPDVAGNWWTLDCPEEQDPLADNDGGGTNQLTDQIRHGCTAPVRAGDVMSGDPGQPDAGQAEVAWAELIDAGTTVAIPVVCGLPTCGPVPSGTGTGATFPVNRIVAVTVCGYHFGKQLKKRYSSTVGACTPSALQAAALMLDDTDASYLLLVSSKRMVSGDNTLGTCVIGDASCDGGLRRVALTE